MVTAQTASGQDLDFVLGVAGNLLSEWGAAQIGVSGDVRLINDPTSHTRRRRLAGPRDESQTRRA
jgi:hypothetical protein